MVIVTEDNFMKKTYLLLHLAVMMLGFSGVFGKLISLNEGLITWYRLILSAVILFILIKVFKIKDRLTWREKWTIAKTGMLITLSWILFYASIKYSNISIGVICYCMASFFTAIFEPLINKGKFRVLEFLLSALTLLGISLIFQFDTTYRLGIILGVSAPVFASLHTIYNERLVKKHDSRLLTYYQMIGGTIGLGVLMPLYLYLFPTDHLLPNWSDMGYLLFLALVCTVGVYVSFTEILKQLSAFTVNLSLNLEPVYAIFIAFVFFDESKLFDFTFYIGLLLVTASVGLQSIFSRKSKPEVVNT